MTPCIGQLFVLAVVQLAVRSRASSSVGLSDESVVQLASTAQSDVHTSLRGDIRRVRLEPDQLPSHSGPELEAGDVQSQPVHGQGTSGFLFIGLGSTDFCKQSSKAVAALQAANLACRSKRPDDEAFCKIAFVGEQDTVNGVLSGCPGQFDVVTTVDLSGCGIDPKADVRARKICVRALGVAPFDHNVFMDMDTITTDRDIESVFDVLRAGFQLTTAFECCARDAKWKLAETTLLHGWEMQTGVVGFERCTEVQKHAKTAIDIYNERMIQQHLSAPSQNAETQALALNGVRFFPLPPNFNLRSQTTTGYRDAPVALGHWHYDTSRELGDLIAEAKKQGGAFLQTFVDPRPVDSPLSQGRPAADFARSHGQLQAPMRV